MVKQIPVKIITKLGTGKGELETGTRKGELRTGDGEQEKGEEEWGIFKMGNLPIRDSLKQGIFKAGNL